MTRITLLPTYSRFPLAHGMRHTSGNGVPFVSNPRARKILAISETGYLKEHAV